MSPTATLVLSVPLSTAFKPFTPMAPPEDELMVSQPGPNGSQLTGGGVGSSNGTPAGRGRPCHGITCGRDGIADSVSGLATAASFEERDATDAVGKGPVSKEQPAERQPVAAGPV